MDIATIGLVFTVCIFGAIGWWHARRRSRPAGPWTFAFLVALAVVQDLVARSIGHMSVVWSDVRSMTQSVIR